MPPSSSDGVSVRRAEPADIEAAAAILAPHAASFFLGSEEDAAAAVTAALPALLETSFLAVAAVEESSGELLAFATFDDSPPATVRNKLVLRGGKLQRLASDAAAANAEDAAFASACYRRRSRRGSLRRSAS